MRRDLTRRDGAIGRRSLLLAGALALATMLPGAAPVEARTLIVDDDNQQCRNATYTSIQDAENDAVPGDIIHVCPGTYDETIVIDVRNITLAGPRSGVANRCGDAGTNPNRDAIITGDLDTGTINVQADGVIIKGFTIQGNDAGPGVFLSQDHASYHIERNIFQDNVFGLYANSDGVRPSTVASNCFRNNNVAGPANGNGIYGDQRVSRMFIQKNEFRNNLNASILITGFSFDPPETHNLTIEQNKIVASGPIRLTNVQRSRIAKNTFTDNLQTAIFFAGNVRDVTVEANQIRNPEFSGINLRAIEGVPTHPAPKPNTNNRIRNNLVLSAGDWGIALRDGSRLTTVENNRVEGSGLDGIKTENGDENIIKKNNVRNNADNGIFIDSDSEANQVTGNFAFDNGDVDCRDETTGSRTAGTDTSWLGNNSNTQNRPGLCR